VTVVDAVHARYVHTRRVEVLARHLVELLPQGARVLDVGCGDGAVAEQVMVRRPDLTIEGIDVLVRPAPRIPVTAFDGLNIPGEDGAFDAVLIVDVLHHASDPMLVLREATRVSRRSVVVKDHLRDRWLADPILRLMDRVGNARHGVALPHTYWSRLQWTTAFSTLGLTASDWREDLHLYPGVADWVFGRGLHFLALLEPAHTVGSESAADVRC
jgi:SAM-dependent methyltransferase